VDNDYTKPPTQQELDAISKIVRDTVDKALEQSKEFQAMLRFFADYGILLESSVISSMLLVHAEKAPVDYERFINDLRDCTAGRDRTRELHDFTRFMLNGTRTTETELDDLVNLIRTLKLR
jgi:hypothetical protein